MADCYDPPRSNGLAVHLRERVRRKRLVSRSTIFVSGWLGLFLGGCTATYQPPDLGGLYNKAAQLGGAQRNPVIVIPGILGSKLRDPRSGELVWGAFSGGAMSPDNPEGARTIALPMEPDKRLDELTDEVFADGRVKPSKNLTLAGFVASLQNLTEVVSHLSFHVLLLAL